MKFTSALDYDEQYQWAAHEHGEFIILYLSQCDYSYRAHIIISEALKFFLSYHQKITVSNFQHDEFVSSHNSVANINSRLKECN